jgi:hypothetical protein
MEVDEILAPQIRPLACHWQDCRRRDNSTERECDAAIHRGIDGDGVGADW